MSESPDAPGAGDIEVFQVIDPELAERAREVGRMVMPAHVEGVEPDATAITALAEARVRAVIGFIFDGMKDADTVWFLSRGFEKAVLKMADRESEIPRDYVGAEVDDLRQLAGLSQEQLSASSNLGLSSLQRFLQGKTHPDTTLPVARMLYTINKALRHCGKQQIDEPTFKRIMLEFQREQFPKRNKNKEPTPVDERKFEEEADDLYEMLFGQR